MRVCPTCGAHYGGQERFCPEDGACLVDEAEARAAEAGEGAEPELGTLLADRYRILEVLGQGAMGLVYRARHEALQRDVAVKVLRRSLSREVGSTRRFLLEARAASQLDHENVISIYDFGRDGAGRYYIVMEYARGESLFDVVRREAPMAQERVVALLGQILSALAAAHAEGIVHRDLKPENIICTARHGEPGFLKILDFGLAKIVGTKGLGAPITRPGLVMGTPEFMSPEQARGEAVDSRSDMYSAGVLAFEMLTGRVPFEGAYVQVVWGHCEEPPPRPSALRPDLEIHPDLELLVLTLLAKRPDERFQNAVAAARVLETIGRKLAARPTEGRNAVERTRAELKKSSVFRTSPEGERSLAMDRSSAVSPSAAETLEPESVWRRSVLLRELSRLDKLRGRHIRELSAMVWSSGCVPDRVDQLRAEVEATEELVEKKDGEIGLLRKRVEARELEARDRQAVLRRRRVDLVARQAAVSHALARAEGAEEMTEDDLEGEVTRSIRDGVAEGLRVDSAASVEQLRAELGELDGVIASTDAETASLAVELDLELAAYERAVRIKLEDLEKLKTRIAQANDELEALVRDAALGRAEASEQLAALDELGEAMDLVGRALAA